VLIMPCWLKIDVMPSTADFVSRTFLTFAARVSVSYK
jgi:hypothetical protein